MTCKSCTLHFIVTLELLWFTSKQLWVNSGQFFWLYVVSRFKKQEFAYHHLFRTFDPVYKSDLGVGTSSLRSPGVSLSCVDNCSLTQTRFNLRLPPPHICAIVFETWSGSIALGITNLESLKFASMCVMQHRFLYNNLLSSSQRPTLVFVSRHAGGSCCHMSGGGGNGVHLFNSQ